MSNNLSASEPARPPPISREHIVILDVVSRPPEDRPTHDTIDEIAEWLVGPARRIDSGTASFDEFAWRLLAAGMPLLRVTLHVGTIHPQFLGSTIVWWRDTGQTTQVMIGHEIGDAIPYEKNPVRRVCEGGETLRRRLDLPDEQLDFDVLIELRERGGTDYIALPIAGAHAIDYMITFVTDRPGGFTPGEIADLTRVARRLAVTVDRYSQAWITHNVLTAYLGARTGPKVLAGQIRRGAGIELTAVLWSSDLRGFTERSDRLPDRDPQRTVRSPGGRDPRSRRRNPQIHRRRGTRGVPHRGGGFGARHGAWGGRRGAGGDRRGAGSRRQSRNGG
jgi:adenylate cyclase